MGLAGPRSGSASENIAISSSGNKTVTASAVWEVCLVIGEVRHKTQEIRKFSRNGAIPLILCLMLILYSPETTNRRGIETQLLTLRGT